MNLAKTPIAASLQKVAEDLHGSAQPWLVILMTDGEETCGGDPKAAIEALRSSGVDVRIDIVGFAIDEVELKETFTEWARIGNGSFYDAQNADDLKRAVRATLNRSFEVLANGTVVAAGTVDGDPLELPVGTYGVRLRGDRSGDLRQVEIASGVNRELKY